MVVKQGQEISPYEKLYGVKPSMDLIYVFGCHVFAHVSVDSWSKTDAKSRTTINLGPAENLNGFLLYDPIMRNTFQCSSVLFDEYIFGIPKLKEQTLKKKMLEYYHSEDIEPFNELKSKLMHRNSREIRSAETDLPYPHDDQYEQDKSDNEYVDDYSSQRV